MPTLMPMAAKRLVGESFTSSPVFVYVQTAACEDDGGVTGSTFFANLAHGFLNSVCSSCATESTNIKRAAAASIDSMSIFFFRRTFARKQEAIVCEDGLLQTTYKGKRDPQVGPRGTGLA